MQEKENVLTLTYDLLLYIVPCLQKFPRSQKFVLADRLQNNLTGLLELLIEAYYSRDERKRAALQTANLQIEKTRYLVRLAKDLHCLDLRRYELIAGKLNEIGVQTGAWLKSLGR
ncbi:MAG: diversity-generating retroelement protein Avd [Thermoanaerobaculia bacterium]|nr:diversity-generating retroelement protein Avd [Thermoanaerobaculia bacterium]